MLKRQRPFNMSSRSTTNKHSTSKRIDQFHHF
nr:MAG TPA: hypothetical protein [Caudoviricetes sp.]